MKGVVIDPTCINLGRLKHTEPNLIHGAVGSIDTPKNEIISMQADTNNTLYRKQ